MGLFDKIFGFSLVAAGVFIAVYWTMWIFMILVSATLILIMMIYLALLLPQVHGDDRVLPRRSVDLQTPCYRTHRWSSIHQLLHR